LSTAKSSKSLKAAKASKAAKSEGQKVGKSVKSAKSYRREFLFESSKLFLCDNTYSNEDSLLCDDISDTKQDNWNVHGVVGGAVFLKNYYTGKYLTVKSNEQVVAMVKKDSIPWIIAEVGSLNALRYYNEIEDKHYFLCTSSTNTIDIKLTIVEAPSSLNDLPDECKLQVK